MDLEARKPQIKYRREEVQKVQQKSVAAALVLCLPVVLCLSCACFARVSGLALIKLIRI